MRKGKVMMVTLDQILDLCSDDQEIILNTRSGDSLRSTPPVISSWLISGIKDFHVTNIEIDGDALVVWINDLAFDDLSDDE